jgi:hypothetical protein
MVVGGRLAPADRGLRPSLGKLSIFRSQPVTACGRVFGGLVRQVLSPRESAQLAWSNLPIGESALTLTVVTTGELSQSARNQKGPSRHGTTILAHRSGHKCRCTDPG